MTVANDKFYENALTFLKGKLRNLAFIPLTPAPRSHRYSEPVGGRCEPILWTEQMHVRFSLPGKGVPRPGFFDWW